MTTTSSSPGGAGARPCAPGVRSDALAHRADRDLEQATAVQARGERLAEPSQRSSQPLTLDLQVALARLELGRHLVELLAERGEVVMPGRRDPRGVVARADAPRGVEEAGELGVQRARQEPRQRQRDEHEPDQQRRDQGAALPLLPGDDRRRLQHGHAREPRIEAGLVERRRAEAARRRLDGPAADRQRAERDAAQRRPQDAVGGCDNRVQAGHAGDAAREVGGGRDGDREGPLRAVAAVDECAEGGEHGGPAAGVGDGLARAHDGQARGAGAPAQGPQPGLQGRVVTGPQRRADREVVDDPLGDGARARARLAGELQRDGLVARQPRVRLARLVVVDEPEEDERHRDERHDDDQQEEDAQLAAEAHDPCPPDTLGRPAGP